MRKLIDVSAFKRDSHEKFNLLNPAEKDSKFKDFFWNHWKKTLKGLAGLFVVLFLWKFLPLNLFDRQNLSDIDPNKFQAVFLTNNQAYFGHISEISESSLILEKIYYFKASPGASSSQQVNLVRLRDEIYGPEDVLNLSNNQVSYWQNLRDDSQVVRMISQLEGK